MLTLQNLGLLSKLVADIHNPTGENRGHAIWGEVERHSPRRFSSPDGESRVVSDGRPHG